MDQALQLFWTKGYEGTTLLDLVDTIGILKPSLYSAFGSKEELFLKVLDLYQNRLRAAVSHAFTLPSGRSSLEDYLRELAKFQSAAGTPHGCLLVQGALVGSEDSKQVTKALRNSRTYGAGIIRSLLERALRQRELPGGTDIDALALYFNAVSHGISVQAVSGVAPKDLQNSITIAMRSWPQTRGSKRLPAPKRRATTAKKAVRPGK